MEAKDTVMEGRDLCRLFINSTLSTSDSLRKVAKAQAEISFKAGQEDVCTVPVSKFIEQGMRKVVEWMARYSLTAYGNYYNIGWSISLKEWQAKLKEWGIKDAD